MPTSLPAESGDGPAGGHPAPQRGMFGVHGSGDTSGFGGLVRRTPVMPVTERPYGGWFDEVADTLAEVFPGMSEAVTTVVVDRDEITFGVRRDRIAELVRTLRDDPSLRFELCSSVSAVDYGPQVADRLHVCYHLTSMTYRRRIRLEVAVGVEDPHVPTVTGVYPTADWQERETYDMFGVIFDGHPGLTRIEMPDDWEGHPQRKDYPLGGIAVEYKGAEIPSPDNRRAYS
jgi:NADH-quinone oxidoreductase subunit C